MERVDNKMPLLFSKNKDFQTGVIKINAYMLREKRSNVFLFLVIDKDLFLKVYIGWI